MPLITVLSNLLLLESITKKKQEQHMCIRHETKI